MKAEPASDVELPGDIAAPEPLMLRAGRLTMQYEKGSLRHIAAGATEMLRAVYPAVRDPNWLTLEPRVVEEKITSDKDSFSIRLTCRYRKAGIDFLARYLIEGGPGNTVTLTMDGQALRTFKKNRIGFCVLHPLAGLTGKPCEITHPDGSVSMQPFPADISPNQVFLNVKGMTWTVDGMTCRLKLEGDVFETEDQRNWTDASFKTYSTPLSLPFPATVEQGTRLQQKVTLEVENIPEGITTTSQPVTLTLFPQKTMKFPAMGIARATDRPPLSDAEIQVLKSLRFDHYRVELLLFQPNWKKKANEALREARQLSYPCELAVFFTEHFEKQTHDLLTWLAVKKPTVCCVLLYHRDHPSTSDNLASYVIPRLNELLPGIPAGTGTNANFAQLNRNRPKRTTDALLCFSVHPQEHASDNMTLVENLAAQSYAVNSARKFSEGRGIWVSPVNLQRRFNANRIFYQPPYRGNKYPDNTDARIMSPFGAAWTVISLKYLAESQVQGITWYETAGERGIFQGVRDSRWPLQFPATRGNLFPVYQMFNYLLNHRKYLILRSVSSAPLVADALVLADGKECHIIAVNFTGNEQEVRLTGCRISKPNPESTTVIRLQPRAIYFAQGFLEQPD
jgi:D-apionolactonase